MTPLHTHTHTIESKENKNSTLECKEKEVKNFPSEECKQSKNHYSPVKLESKKNDKKKYCLRGTGRVGRYNQPSRKSYLPCSIRY